MHRIAPQAAATATGWRVLNGLPLQQRWGVRELRLFSDEACTSEITGGFVFSSGAELSFGLDEPSAGTWMPSCIRKVGLAYLRFGIWKDTVVPSTARRWRSCRLRAVEALVVFSSSVDTVRDITHFGMRST